MREIKAVNLHYKKKKQTEWNAQQKLCLNIWFRYMCYWRLDVSLAPSDGSSREDITVRNTSSLVFVMNMVKAWNHCQNRQNWGSCITPITVHEKSFAYVIVSIQRIVAGQPQRRSRPITSPIALHLTKIKYIYFIAFKRSWINHA